MSRAALVSGLVALACWGYAGCVDTSPIDYRPPLAPGDAGDDGAPADAAVDAEALVSACRQCATEGPCKAAYDVCTADTKCGAYVACTVAAYCLNYQTTDLANLPTCVFSCAIGSGFTGQDDPSLVPFLPFIQCAQDPSRCGAACNQPSVH